MKQHDTEFKMLMEYLMMDKRMPDGLVAFKQFRRDKSGNLHPLFVNADWIIPTREWLKAEEGKRTPAGKVKSKLGPLAYRPGWHLSEVPYAPHIGVKEDGVIKYQRDDTVWALCVVTNHIDWTGIARSRGFGKNGKYDSRKACLDFLPTGGYYWFTTNPNAYGNWLISEMLWVHQVLTDEQVEWICWNLFEIHAQPRKAV